MVTLAPTKPSPLDSEVYHNSDEIRTSIAVLHEQTSTHDENVHDEGVHDESIHREKPSAEVEPKHRFAPANKIAVSNQNANQKAETYSKKGVIGLIAAYNESRFIGSVVISALRHVERVVVVDDGSQDNTAAIARQAGADVVEMEQNSGKGSAIQHGIDIILGLSGIRAITLLDGDGQHDPCEIPIVTQPVLDGNADLVVGSRFLDVKSDIPSWRQIGQHGLTLFTNVASGTPLTDSQSGFRALSPDAARQLKFQTSDFSMESEMQFAVHDLDLTAIEVPITCVYEEPSKRNPVLHGIEVVMGIVRLVAHIRPLFFGTICALGLWLAGAALSIDVIIAFNQGGTFPLTSSLLSVGLIIIGSTAFICGIVLQSVRDLMKAYLVQKVDI